MIADGDKERGKRVVGRAVNAPDIQIVFPSKRVICGERRDGERERERERERGERERVERERVFI